MTHTFSYRAVLYPAWATFKQHWKFLALAGLATFIIQMGLQSFQNIFHRGFLSLLATLVVGLITIVVLLGWSRVVLQLNRENRSDWNTFKTTGSVWLRYIKVMLWYALFLILWIIVAAIIPVIIYGIGAVAQVYWLKIVGAALIAISTIATAVCFGIRYQFINYVTLEHPELSSRLIFKKSGNMTKNNTLRLFGFSIMLGLINLVGLLGLGVGLLITIPVTKMAQGRVYDILK